MIKWRATQTIYERNGFLRKRIYRSESCEGCPLKKTCTKAEGDREPGGLPRLSLAHNLLKKAANDQNRSHSGVGITS
ncbi:transposase [Paenibacillus lautus]